MREIALVLVLILCIGLIVDVAEPAYGFFGRVPTGYVGVITHFGKISDEIYDAGFHLKGFFAKINKMDVRTQKATTNIAAFSSDIQQVNTSVTINYNVSKENAMVLFSEIGKDYLNTLIAPRLQENVKIVFARYSAENLIQNREMLSTEICSLMREDLGAYGIDVSAIAVEDIDFTDAFTNAVEAKQVASQEKLTAQTQQERLTMEAQAQAERATIEATAQAERAKIEADAEAYVIQTKAEAEAAANAKVAASLTQELIDYTKAQLWNGEMPSVMGDATPILDMTDFVFED